MDDNEALKLLQEMKTIIFPEVVKGTGSSVRLRSKPVMNKVKRVHGSAYILGNVSRHLWSAIQENPMVIPLVTQIRSNFPNSIEMPSGDSENYPFDELTRRGMDHLKRALMKTIEESSEHSLPLTPDPASRIKQISVSSVVNKRRRQEDRWFFEPDLVAYAPIEPDRTAATEKLRSGAYPRVIGAGVFDGHGGPEAAEHCSNLAPFLLSRRLQQRFLEPVALRRSSQTLPDVLSDVIHELNLSVSECHRKRLWNSGTTATICLIHGAYIYTAWVGDSQCVLFNLSSTTTSVEKVKPTPPSPPASPPPPPPPNPQPPSIETPADIPHIDCDAKPVPISPPPASIFHQSSGLTSPTSPRSRAARWGQPFAWITSLVRSGTSTSTTTTTPDEHLDQNPSPAEPDKPLEVRAPLATQEVEESDLLEPQLPMVPSPLPMRYGSLPSAGKKKGASYRNIFRRTRGGEKSGGGGGGGGGSGNSSSGGSGSNRLSAHFSEPSLNVASSAVAEATTVLSGALAPVEVLSADHRGSPSGGLRGSRSTSVIERPASDTLQAFCVLTPLLHRPENTIEFVSVLRAGGCVTFKAADDCICSSDCDSEFLNSSTASRGFARLPAPLMTSAQLLFVPDLSIGGTYRVGSISGVSRSLGAATSLIPGLSGLPSLSAHRLATSTCLILASDGLWDTFSCSADDITHFFTGTPNRDFAKLLTARAVRNGSTDNVTVLILWLEEAQKPSNGPMEVDLQTPAAFPLQGSRNASVPARGDWRLRGRMAIGALGPGEAESALPRYCEPEEKGLSRSQSVEDLADRPRLRAASPMRVLP